jgi:tRNA dimethylallyltransferase
VTVVAIFGPTASGKSAVAMALARQTGGEIVSCDAMQAYRGLAILTNQPPAADLAAVPHHLVGVWDLDEAGDVATYGGLAHAAIDGILGRGLLPIVCGGTGLYLRAAVADLNLPPEPEPGQRARIEAEYDRDGPERSHERLRAVDPPAAARVHPNDRRRVVRALELRELGSSLVPAADVLWEGPTRHPTVVAGVVLPRPELRRRIAERTTAMFDAGAREEARAAVAAHAPSHTAARALGLDLVLGDDPEAVANLTRRTCAYARRQETWMRRIPGLVPLDGMRSPADLARELAGRIAA